MNTFYLGVALLLIFGNASAQNNSDSLINFIKENRKKFAIFAVQNNRQQLAFNESETVPLATMSDLLVATEFAKQATYKVVDSGESTALKEIVTFHLENKFQPEYEDWLTHLLITKKIQDQNTNISLAEIAHGMLKFGAQPNTEFLIEKVGFDNIKSSIVSYNLTGHTTIAYPIGALALYQNRKKTAEKKMFKAIDDLNDDGYSGSSNLMHLALRGDTAFKNKIPANFATEKVMRHWANNLPQGTVKSYGNLLLSFLKEKTLDARFYKTLRNVLEWKINEPNIANQYSRYFEKTSVVINAVSQAKFLKTTDGMEQVIVYSFYDLTPAQVNFVKRNIQNLDNALTTSNDFAAKLRTTLLAK